MIIIFKYRDFITKDNNRLRFNKYLKLEYSNKRFK